MMHPFPSTFSSCWQASRALAYLSIWSGGRSSNIWIPQFASLRNHVREISRTAAGSRVHKLTRALSIWPDAVEVAASLPSPGASDLFAACLEEGPSLLELGYPAGEGLDFITRLPSPGVNTRRTPAQMRAAVHHMGGDFELLRTMMRVPDPFAPCLRIVFSVWPRFLPPEEHESLHIGFPGQRLPAQVSFRRDLRGYCMLVLFDLAHHLRAAEGIPPMFDSFGKFAEWKSAD